MKAEERRGFCTNHPEMFQYHRYGAIPIAVTARHKGEDYETYRSRRRMINTHRKNLMKRGVRSRLVKKVVARTNKDGTITLVNKGLGTLRYSDYAGCGYDA